MKGHPEVIACLIDLLLYSTAPAARNTEAR